MGAMRNPGFNANLWWIDLRFANRTVEDVFMCISGGALLSFAISPRWAPFRGWFFSGLLSLLIMIAASNAWTYFQLVFSGNIRTSALIPLSLVVLLVLCLILFASSLRHRMTHPTILDRASFAASIVLASFLFPLAQMYCFGFTDYRRPADLIVVFGCRVFADGTPSMALSDRVKTGVELYQAGLAPRIVFSGGPGDGDIHETEAMRRLAMKMGVPDHSILVDEQGLNTHATVKNLVSGNGIDGKPRVLAVSNFYHLPRIKLCFRRAGWEVWTVPAKESRRLYRQELYLMREVAALWWYYLNPT
jgi:vancomycin permeability regulator SanA